MRNGTPLVEGTFLTGESNHEEWTPPPLPKAILKGRTTGPGLPDNGRRHDDGHRHDDGRHLSRAVGVGRGEGANIANICK